MLFPTITFAIFYVVVFAIAWRLQGRNVIRKAILLLASLIFYGWWDWRFCFLLMTAALTSWGAGLLIGRSNSANFRSRVLAIAVTTLLLVLGFFKYYGFFLTSMQDLLFTLGLQRDLPFMQIILPVGISFFTFQAISYVVDVYREQVEHRENPLDVMLYISFFPQLVAGPIVRAADFLPQLEKQTFLTKSVISSALVLCLCGLFKKMIVANYLATDLVDPVFLEPGSYSSVMVLLATYGYAVQIYCDFSGYSDIAIGTAALLGFKFRTNFDRPYSATTLQDFWRRWHISLSQWLRDYLYIPLGGSHTGRWKTYRNLFVTMLLGGLWHGAAWNFVAWGCLHGMWLSLERAVGGKSTKTSKSMLILGWLVTFHVVCAAWVFFRASDLTAAAQIFSTLSLLTAEVGQLTWFTLALVFVPLLLQFSNRDFNTMIQKFGFGSSLALFAIGILFVIWVAPSGTAPFIYFQF